MTEVSGSLSSTPGSDGQQQISDDLLALTSRVSDGEGVQEQIQETISNALDTQSNIQETISNALDTQSNIQETVSNALDTQSNIQETVSNALDTQSNIQGNIIELEEEIESLAPSLDRGKWNLATLGTGVTLAAGEYAMGIGVDSVYCQEKYLECVANANNDPFLMSECTRLAGECENAKDNGNEYYINDWSHATFLHFYKTDSEGKNHTFSDYEVGMFIDLFDQGDSGFAVFEITAAPELNGDVYTIGVTPIQHKGEASGLARIKVFELAGIDPTEFVRKTGDTMEGMLQLQPNSATPPLYVYPHKDAGDNIYCIRQFSTPRTNPETGSTARETVFYTTTSGDISGSDNYTPSKNRHLTNVQYVQDQISKLYYPARYSWRVQTKTTAGPSAGYIQFDNTSMSNSSEVRINFKSYDGKLDLFDVGDGKAVYMGASGSSMMLTGYYIGNDTDNKWKWKGTANLKKITILNRNGAYFKCELGPYQTSNHTFTDGNRYYFTISGLF